MTPAADVRKDWDNFLLKKKSDFFVLPDPGIEPGSPA